MDLGLHIAVHARKKSFLRHTVRLSPFSAHRGQPSPHVLALALVRHEFEAQRVVAPTKFFEPVMAMKRLPPSWLRMVCEIVMSVM